ncbi:MAG: PAS domain S-box protein [Pyrinomonadaceae bacterium]
MAKDQPDGDRRLVDQALRESEERYRAFIANSTEGIWRFELEQPVPLNLSRGLPGSVWDGGRPLWIDDFGKASSFPRAHLAAREGIGAAACFPLLLHGEIIGVMEFFSHESRQPDDHLLELMDAVGIQVAQLIEHGEVQQARNESEERLRLLAETASDGIITVDESSSIIFVNPAAGRIFGYSPEEMMGQSFDDADAGLPPARAPRWNQTSCSHRTTTHPMGRN